MRKVLIGLAAAALLATGCSSGPAEPDADAKAALIDALRAVTESDGITQELTLLSTVESLQAATRDAGNELPTAAAQNLLDSSLVVSQTQPEDPSDTTAEVLASIGGRNVFEVRIVDDSLFLRADVDRLVRTFGGDPAAIDLFVGPVQNRPGFEWLRPALDGEFLVIRNLDRLTKQLGAPRVRNEEKITQAFLDTVRDNASVSDAGDEDPGTHLIARLPVRETLADLTKLIGSAGVLPPGAGFPDVTEIPEGTISIDFWLDDGTLTQVEVDLLQFQRFASADERLPEQVEELGVRVTLEEFDGNVEPVANAIELDPRVIAQALAFVMPASPSFETSEKFDCSQLKGAPPEVVELYAAECPGLQN